MYFVIGDVALLTKNTMQMHITNKINGYKFEGIYLSERKTKETTMAVASIKSRRRKLFPEVLTTIIP
jgi:hypothetical protein